MTPGHRYGIVRVSPAGVWSVLADDAHNPSGLTGVTTTPTGALVVSFVPLASLGVFFTAPDETYAGRFDVGASAALNRLVITFRRPGTSTAVSCRDVALRLPSSNVQIAVWGTEP